MWNPGSNAVFLESSYPVDMDVEEFRDGNATVCKRTVHTPGGDIHQTTKVADNVYTTWQTEHWCKSVEDVDRALSVPYEPVEYDASDYVRIEDEVGDNGIIMASLADPLWLAADLMEFGEYTVWAMTETEHFARTVSAMHERNMENLRRMLEVNVVDLYRICGPEYATAPYLPPEFFEQFVVPYVAEMVHFIHRKGAKTRFHCHGRIGGVLDMIVETGADSIDPCEGPPDGDVALSEVKERVERTMCIFGNIQLKLLEGGTEKEVEQEVRACMNAAKDGGGYVIMPTAAPINTPLAKKTEANYLQFIETALQYGDY
jgi:uroporphyrinogen-III decarboxylase